MVIGGGATSFDPGKNNTAPTPSNTPITDTETPVSAPTIKPTYIPTNTPIPTPAPTATENSTPTPTPASARRPVAPSPLSTPTREPKRTMTSVPSPTETPYPTFFYENFSSYPIDSKPPNWHDPSKEGFNYTWLLSANLWTVKNVGTNRVFQQSIEYPQPSLSFRVYEGPIFDAINGELPDIYEASADVQPISSKFYRPPTGDLGIQVYYISPTQYIEVMVRNVTKDNNAVYEVWLCDKGLPQQKEGWTRLFWKTIPPIKPYDVLNLGARINCTNHTVEPLLNGEPIGKIITNSFIRKNQKHKFAVRASGSLLNVDKVSIIKLFPELVFRDKRYEYIFHDELNKVRRDEDSLAA